MLPIASISELDAAIISLKAKQAGDLGRLKNELRSAQKSLSPANVIKSTFTELVSSTDSRNDLLTTAISLAINLISKKSPGPLVATSSKMFSGAAQIALSLVLSKFGPQLKNILAAYTRSGDQQSQQK
jgi:hypothetical protein